jgi:hypothetical protein
MDGGNKNIPVAEVVKPPTRVPDIKDFYRLDGEKVQAKTGPEVMAFWESTSKGSLLDVSNQGAGDIDVYPRDRSRMYLGDPIGIANKEAPGAPKTFNLDKMAIAFAARQEKNGVVALPYPLTGENGQITELRVIKVSSEQAAAIQVLVRAHVREALTEATARGK